MNESTLLNVTTICPGDILPLHMHCQVISDDTALYFSQCYLFHLT